MTFDVAVEGDVPVILGLIKELAEYENLLDQVIATESEIRQSLFGSNKGAEVILIHHRNQVVGFDFFYNYSTFLEK